MNIIESLQVKPQTKVGYKYLFLNLERNGFNWSSTPREIREFLSAYPVQKQLDLLNVIIVIYRELGNDIEDLKDIRTHLQLQNKDCIHAKLTDLDLMSPAEFLTKLNTLFEQGKYMSYILNYLCYHYGVRNEDLRIHFNSPDGNYLVRTKNGIEYIRTNYKTVTTYGPKRHIITDAKFSISYDNIPDGVNCSGSMSSYLKTRLIMNEGKIFKMRIKSMEDRFDTEGIQVLACSRGTSISCVLSNYNINCSKYVIR
jgi:hypothetical protein